MSLRYIILNENKRPTEKLTDGGHPLEDVKGFDNLAVLIPEPFIVLDFDTVTDAEIMFNIIQDLKIKCLIMKTTRGYHFWFKSPEPWKNFTKTRLAIGLYADCRSYGKLSYTVVKKDGEWREWVQKYPADEVEEVPFWLRPVSAKYEFKGMKEGDGRNQALFEYILTLQSKGFNREQIKQIIRLINEYVLGEPLSEQEINTILRDESFKDAAEIADQAEVAACFDEQGSFKHNLFAQLLVEKLNIITVNEQCYIYEDGYYQRADRAIDKKMVELYPTIRKAQRAEVIDYIKIITNVKPESIPKQEYIINLKNCRLDLRTGKTLPFDPAIIDFCRIPVSYDPNAYSADLDRMLRRVFEHDQEVIDLFDEMVGYMLIKNCRFRKGFLFFGSGHNGKSTVLNLLKRFIGEENCATIELEKLNDPFKTAELENKLANIGDDIDRRDIVDTGTLKKLFTGESFTVERKYQNPFTLKSYAKLIFSCNEIPRIADKSQGMYSRLMFIPFTAVFSPEDEDFDPFIEEKITTDEALSYLLNRAIKGLHRLLSNNGFTHPARVQEAFTRYETANSIVLTWIEEEGVEMKHLLGSTTDKLFSDFKDWCARYDVKHSASLKTFHNEIERKYSLYRVRVRNSETDDKYKWKFVVKLE